MTRNMKRHTTYRRKMVNKRKIVKTRLKRLNRLVAFTTIAAVIFGALIFVDIDLGSLFGAKSNAQDMETSIGNEKGSESQIPKNLAYRIETGSENNLLINEFKVDSKSGLLDETDSCVDWLELYNNSEVDILLSNYYLSDVSEYQTADEVLKFRLPEITLKPKSYYLIYLSGKSAQDLSKVQHTNFRMSVKGKRLILSSLKIENDKTGIVTICGEVDMTGLQKDTAYIRNMQIGSKENVWIKTDYPTPGGENKKEIFQTLANQVCVEYGRTISISEVMTSNDSTYKDKNGEYNDWLEVRNNSNAEISLAGIGLSDDFNDRYKWTFPEVKIPAGGYIVVFASGKNVKEPLGELHTNFSISRIGESLILTDKDGKTLDYMVIPVLDSDMSYGRSADTKEMLYYTNSTPGGANGAGYRERLDKPVYSKIGGVISVGADDTYVELSSMDEGVRIHYTTDCSVPTESSTVYSSPIKISSTTVLRTVAIKQGAISSNIETNTYFMGIKHDLEVISLVLEPKDLFDENIGIYATGKNASSEFPYKGANFWQDWEKPAHIEFYDKQQEQGFSLNVGVKIFGAYSRAADQKSFSIISRSKYDDTRIEYPLFEDKPQLTSFKSLVLRTSGQDYNLTKIRDALMGQLFAGTNVDYQSYRPSVVYLNGEYWGIYNIREKISEHFLAQNHDIEDPSKIDIIESNTRVKQGSNEEYLALIKFVTDNDMKKKENYEYVKTKMDIANYIDYQIAEIYCANTDLVNIRFWKPQTQGGKWRWILYDTDWGMFSKDVDSFAMAISPNGNGVGKANNNVLMRKLIWNEEFQKQFIDRLCYMLKNNLSTQNVLAQISLMSGRISSEIPNEIARWKHWSSFDRWNTVQLDRLRNWAKEEPSRLVEFVIKDLKLGSNSAQAVALRAAAAKAIE